MDQEIPVSDPPPQAIDVDVRCPLCEYNLRGLIEPRCPECGFRFEWDDLLKSERLRHPYLFEHHPRRKTWSFFKTLIGGLRPKRFWTSLHPAQSSYPWRLIAYWIVAHLAIMFMAIQIVAADMAVFARYVRSSRQMWIREYNSQGQSGAWLRNQYSTPAKFQQYLDANYPLPPSARFFRRAMFGWNFRAMLSWMMLPLVVLAWPWLTCAGLMVFRISMRRARIRSVHVLRCIIYCSDAALWISVGSALLVLVGFWTFPPEFWRMIAPISVAIYIVWFSWRLRQAYRHYLQFDHPLMTVIASQVIAGLLLLNLLIPHMP